MGRGGDPLGAVAHDDEPTEPFDPVPGEARVGSRESLEGRADEPTRPLGADPTRPLGEGTADASTDATTGREPARGLRRFAPYLVGAAIALGVGIALLVDAVDDDPVTTGAPPDGVVTVPTTVRVAAPPRNSAEYSSG